VFFLFYSPFYALFVSSSNLFFVLALDPMKRRHLSAIADSSTPADTIYTVGSSPQTMPNSRTVVVVQTVVSPQMTSFPGASNGRAVVDLGLVHWRLWVRSRWRWGVWFGCYFCGDGVELSWSCVSVFCYGAPTHTVQGLEFHLRSCIPLFGLSFSFQILNANVGLWAWGFPSPTMFFGSLYLFHLYRMDILAKIVYLIYP
jgi:hypothetical protein